MTKRNEFEQWEPLVFAIVQIGLMFIALAMQRQPIITFDHPETITALSKIANKIALAGSDPFAALLFASNVGSMFYGVWFYAVRRKEDGPLAWTTVLYFAALIALSIAASPYGPSDPTRANTLSAMIQYFGSVAITLYFLIVDFLGYRYFAKNNDDAKIMALSSTYISFPCLLTLGFTWLIHILIISTGIKEDVSVAFLSGASAVLLVLSNLIFALVLHPRYMSNLEFKLEKKKTKSPIGAQVTHQ